MSPKNIFSTPFRSVKNFNNQFYTATRLFESLCRRCVPLFTIAHSVLPTHSSQILWITPSCRLVPYGLFSTATLIFIEYPVFTSRPVLNQIYLRHSSRLPDLISFPSSSVPSSFHIYTSTFNYQYFVFQPYRLLLRSLCKNPCLGSAF